MLISQFNHFYQPQPQTKIIAKSCLRGIILRANLQTGEFCEDYGLNMKKTALIFLKEDKKAQPKIYLMRARNILCVIQKILLWDHQNLISIQQIQMIASEIAKMQGEKKIERVTSFTRKNSIIHVKQSGEEQRPHINRAFSTQGLNDKVYELMQSYLPKDVPSIEKQIVNHVEYTLARTRFNFKTIHCYLASAYSVRDRLIQYFNDTNRCLNYSGKKKIYYLSLEFLIGRCFQNALVNLNLEKDYAEALRDLGFHYERVRDKEIDPALGNGGLGRLAACFLDSLATLNFPAWGYGIRYDYGIFRQMIKNGFQVEVPDFWLGEGNPWEIQRVDVQYKINFYGKTKKYFDPMGKQKVIWEDYETIIARAYDTPIPGYATFNTIGLRLWKSLPINQFDFSSFNSGQYYKALESRQKAEYITSVLYPNDNTIQGKQLRLKQEYLLVSATVQDIIRRHKSNAKLRDQRFDWRKFPKEAAIQLNDTHPALAIVELLRILLDQQGLDQETSWQIVYDTFSYTNHTVLPEALEKWSVELLGSLLPRHLELIYLINHVWLQKISKKILEQEHTKLNSLSIIEQSKPKKIRMANLCIVGSHKVNGVAKIHSQLVKTTLFKDFCEIFPNKFVNVTNGVTTRRWILCCNPLLAELYTSTLNTDEWLTNMSLLKKLEVFANNQQFQSKWTAIKQNNKHKLVEWIKKQINVDVNQNTMFDIQIKRIHQYKRQFMNILYVIHRYLSLKAMDPVERNNTVPRTVMFAGKAASGYENAKKIIKLINEVSYVVNNDEATKSLLKVIFIPNYNVSAAEVIIPAAELSQHISLAGTQASGTSNMKFVLNGSMIIGTMDGANVEIYDEVGAENIFIFGARVDQVDGLKENMSRTAPEKYLPQSLQNVIQSIREGKFGEREVLMSLVSTITNSNDWYLIGSDFESYIKCQEEVDKCYLSKNKWTKMSIMNAIRSGKFSSDRSIMDYAKNIWNLEPCKVLEDMLEAEKKCAERIQRERTRLNRMDSTREQDRIND